MECPALEPISNGVITYTPDIMADYDMGTLALYSCDFGFILVGSESRLCVSGGIWAGQPPECQCKIVCILSARLRLLSFIQLNVQHWHPFQTELLHMVLI